MAEDKENLGALFASSPDNELPPDILGELESMLRLHSITPKELFYKWESYCLKMGSEETKMNLDTVRMFKKDVQDAVERESRGKHNARISDRRANASATPRNVGNGDVFGILDSVIPNTPMPPSRIKVNGTSTKRKAAFDSPATSKTSRSKSNGTPANFKTPGKVNGKADGIQAVPFSERQNASQIIETLNDHLPTAEAPIVPFAEPRVKVVANTDLKKFSYKPMSMRLSESSEVLDERIDEFMSIIQKAHGLKDSAFDNPTAQSTSEIIAVGRIACDTPESRLTAASLVLETSRRMGAGVRVPLKMGSVSYQFFPGKIVALKGSNASGEYFSVSEILSVPLLPPATSSPAALESTNARLGGGDDSSSALPLSYLVSCGPYTADDNLDFEPLKELCQKAEDLMADTVILAGPFLDLEHPLLASGDFDLPESKSIDPQPANMATLFRLWITPSFQKLASAVPGITIILIPSVRDAVNRHVSWPQDMFQSRKELGLPKQAKLVSNPITFSLNETVFGISTEDILYELRQEELSTGNSSDLLTRLPRHLVEQRHFFPLFPPTSRDRLPKAAGGDRLATGACLDLGYLKLGEWWNVKPDVLITPSALPPFVKVVESVLTLNPGPLSKRRAAGTYAHISLQPRMLTDEEKKNAMVNGNGNGDGNGNKKGNGKGKSASVAHKVFERARVDVVRI